MMSTLGEERIRRQRPLRTPTRKRGIDRLPRREVRRDPNDRDRLGCLEGVGGLDMGVGGLGLGRQMREEERKTPNQWLVGIVDRVG